MGTYPGNSRGFRFIPACPAGRRVGSGRKNNPTRHGDPLVSGVDISAHASR